MTLSISSVKSQAKKALSGNWVVAIVSAMSLLFSVLIIQNIAWVVGFVVGNFGANFINLLLSVLLCGPLTLGILRLFWRINGGVDESPLTAFYYFSGTLRYYKAVKLCFMLSVRLLIFAAIFYLPSFVLYVISSPDFYEFLKMPIPMWSQHINLVVDFLSSIGMALTIFSLVRFYIAPILVVANEEIDVDEALHMSTVISKASLTDLIFLILSMFLWIIISILFIPLVFTLPYFIMCYVIHCEAAIKEYNEKVKKLIDDKLPSFVAGV